MSTTSYISLCFFSLIVLVNISLCCDIVTIRTKLLSNKVLFAAFVVDSFHPPPSASSIISAVSHCLLNMEAWFNPRPVHVGFVVDRVAMKQVFGFPPSLSFHLSFLSIYLYITDVIQLRSIESTSKQCIERDYFPLVWVNG